MAFQALQRRLVYFPDARAPDAAARGVPGVAVGRTTTQDGLSLLTWYAPPDAEDGLVVLYLHGNAGNIGNRAGRLLPLNDAGWGVLLLEYRGYGGNPGTPSEDGLWLDAQAGMAALRRIGVPPERTLLWGESLGTGLAVRLAAESPVAAVLLEAPYTSLAAVGRWHAPMLPMGLLLGRAYDSLSLIPKVRSPVLVMAGARDTLIPPAISRELYDAATSPKELWIAPDADHNTLADAGAIAAAADFVRRHVTAAAP